MQSLKDKFDELCLRLGHGRGLESTGAEPIYYFVFPASQILKAKQETAAWTAKLHNKGWQVETLSMGETLNGILRGHRFRRLWLSAEKSILAESQRSGSPLDFREINVTITKAMTEGTALVDILKKKIDETATKTGGLLLITDLEALHPYLRINSLELQLQGAVKCPIVVLYPGKREGKTSLRFLEFYPADPNYRSEHIG